MDFTKLNEDKTYTIRQMQIGDAEQYKNMRLEALQTEPGVFGNSYATEVAYPEELWRDRMTNSYGACFGLFCDYEMVGITAVTIHDKEMPHDAYLSQSYIRLSHRGKGLSKMLYEARLQWARTHNVHRLVVGHKKTNLVSKNANQNFGFTYTHSESRLWPDGSTADMLYYELTL